MKLHFVLVAALTLATASRGRASYYSMVTAGSDSRVTVTVKADGSARVTNEATQPRKVVEMQITAWQRYHKNAENGEPDDNAPPPAPAPKTETKPLSDQELAAKLREMNEERPEPGEGGPRTIDSLEVLSNSVRIVATRSFASLKDLLGEGVWNWGPIALMVEDARFEIDTNQQLRITFIPSKEAARRTNSTLREWKAAKVKSEWKLVLPGKILSSGLPQTQENTTGFTLEGEKAESAAAALKLIGSPLVVIAEPGGLKLDEPLQANKLAQARWRGSRSTPDLPVTDAGPGFTAEPLGISLSTVYYFPEGKKALEERPEASAMGLGSPGAVISARLFPPKGRTIRSVSELKVKKAKDDKGRAIGGASEAGGEQESYQEFFSGSDDSEKGGAARLELHLGLPAPDAQTIDELEAEAVALTIGGWKEMTITNAHADTNMVIDLGEVLPDAKMVIKKVTGKKPQTTLEARLEGPAAVNQLELKVKLSSKRGGSSNMSERQTSTSGGKTTRNVTLQSYEFNMGEMGGGGSPTPLTLLVRFPQDVKRERVQFKLSALDLL